ncbi:MAG: hypothetical protein EXQ57_09820 [Bryobacterales bacterium]|nr:hypothetical protein [Bryobacterales bacterium]
MKHYTDSDSLRRLPLHPAPEEGEKLFAKARLELDQRGAFVGAYKARGGRDGNGQKLDPVLAFHLGLE